MLPLEYPIQTHGFLTSTPTAHSSSGDASRSSEWIVGNSELRFFMSVVDKSLVPYRQCSADRVPLIPCRRSGAVWIRRFGPNRVGIWQDNCFKEFHCSAAISCRLRQRICDCGVERGGGCMQFVLPNRTPLPATREAGLVQIAKSLTDNGTRATWTKSRLYVQLRGQQLTLVRCLVCRLQLLSNVACSQYSVLWFARRHAQGETGSAQALLPNHGRAVHRTSVDHVARDVECSCSRQSS